MLVESKRTGIGRSAAILTISAAVLLAGAALLLGLVPGLGLRVVETHGRAAWDENDLRRVVGASTDVFVGRVIAQVGEEGLPTSKPGYSIPHTQFSVEVLETIKGDLSGEVVVNQTGGYAMDGAERVLVLEDGDPLLVPGRMYVLAAAPDTETAGRWYDVIAEGHGDVRIEDGRHKAEVIAAFARAHRDEFIYDRATHRFRDERR